MFSRLTGDMTHNDLAATSSLLRTTGPSTWPTQRGKLVGRRPIPQRLYGRPDTGKADTSTYGRILHRKDDRRGGSV
ncbi:hypothetical protein BHE74_00007775 [Ensete ventricosum]|nr:hypothetical protein BHE74_00007775 [Ensete ventricosum]